MGRKRKRDSNTNIVSRETVTRAAEIFQEHGPTIRAIINSQVTDEWDADDIYQDFFLSLVHKPIPSNIRDVRSYIYRAVKNDVIDALRRIRSYRNKIKRYADRREYNQPKLQPSDKIVTDEEIAVLYNIIEKNLRPREAQAVKCRYRNDQNIAEAAKTMGVNRRTLSRYLCVGLKKIREVIDEQYQL